jgi:hypothetical protein
MNIKIWGGLVIVFGAFLTGCSSLPQPISKADGKSLVQGTDNQSQRVLIRTLDNGDVLWVGQYQLGTEAWLAPGHHTIGVMCEFHNSWGNELSPGNVEIDVLPQHSYQLTGSPKGQNCVLEVKEASK